MTVKEPKSLNGQQVDLASLNSVAGANKGYRLELMHPVSRKGLGAFITVLGRDSDTYNQILHDRTNELMRKRSLENRYGKETELKSSEQLDAEEIELLIACTISFEDVTFEGKILDFNAMNALKLYSIPWVKQQVSAAIHEVGNFIQS